jgi:peroxin-19
MPSTPLLNCPLSKFPGYLKDNASKLSGTDKKRFKSQFSCVSKILAAFDQPTYSDDDPDSVTKLVGLMTEVCCFSACSDQ